MIGSKTILLKRGNNAYAFTWVLLDKPVAECFAQGICRLLNSQGAQAVTGKPYLVTMCGGLGSAASQPLCFPSSTCHLSSSHPIRCIYLGQKGLPMSHIINILDEESWKHWNFKQNTIRCPAREVPAQWVCLGFWDKSNKPSFSIWIRFLQVNRGHTQRSTDT